MADDLFGGWLAQGTDPTSLPEHVVENANRWDWRDWEHAQKELSALRAAGDALCDVTDTGAPLMADAFMALLKVAPRLLDTEGVRPSHLLNRMVMGELVDLAEYQDLHRYTTGDDVAAGMALASIEPDIEELVDREQNRQSDADDLDQLMQQLAQATQSAEDLERQIEELMKEWAEQRWKEGEGIEGDSEGDGGAGEEQDGDGDGDGSDGQGGGSQGPPGLDGLQAALDQANAKLTQLRAQCQAAIRALIDGLAQARPDIRCKMQEALSRAANEAKTLAESAETWGKERGELLRMPADERLALAKRLNTPRLQQIAEKFGPMKQLMFAEQARKVRYVKSDLVDIEHGKDVARLLPSELVKLRDPRRKLLFYKDFTQRRLLQYRLEGEERVGKGGIILCEDGSGSMQGIPELRAKAFMLCLLHLARKERRQFHLIHFGSAGELYPIDFSKPEDFTTERILAAAELFCNGGTDFESPLNMAVERLQEEHRRAGRIQGDIVFLTDGYCGVSPRWMEWFKEEQSRLQFQTWGVALAHGRGDEMAKTMEPLHTICDGRIALWKDLQGGGDVREVFRGV